MELRPGSKRDQFIAAFAGGVAPDVFVIGSGIPGYAQNHMISPITSSVQEDGFSATDFFPAGWMEVQWKGDVWALPLTLDPNFALLGNRRLLEEAGLPGETLPTTIAVLDNHIHRLTQLDADGRAPRLGCQSGITRGVS